MKGNIMRKPIILYNFSEQYANVLKFQVTSLDISLQDAIQKALNEYARTKKGKAWIKDCSDMITYMDFFETVPNEICEKYGFQKESCLEFIPAINIHETIPITQEP